MLDKEIMELFYELFDESLPRLGPGDDRSTKKALDILFQNRSQTVNEPNHGKLKVLDIGCGTGAQTIQLAKYVDGTILAVDNHQPYLDELQRRARAVGVLDKIQPCLKDMRDLREPDGPFDLIWSEGALFVMGFNQGVAACRSLLVPAGLLGVSELCWLRSDPPTECRKYFENMYPAMTDIDTNRSMIRSHGFNIIDHFTIPESSWWESYYHPLEHRLQLFRKKYADVPKRLDLINSVQMEIDMYRKYSNYYGNVFFLMQRSQ
jgi:cyclopropane fatty-acyl-phospholipid synthase-like methyltransferase